MLSVKVFYYYYPHTSTVRILKSIGILAAALRVFFLLLLPLKYPRDLKFLLRVARHTVSQYMPPLTGRRFVADTRADFDAEAD